MEMYGMKPMQVSETIQMQESLSNARKPFKCKETIQMLGNHSNARKPLKG